MYPGRFVFYYDPSNLFSLQLSRKIVMPYIAFTATHCYSTNFMDLCWPWPYRSLKDFIFRFQALAIEPGLVFCTSMICNFA